MTELIRLFGVKVHPSGNHNYSAKEYMEAIQNIKKRSRQKYLKGDRAGGME